MTPSDNKKRRRELVTIIQKSTQAEALAIRELMALRLQDLKCRLVDAEGDDIIRTQGAARAVAAMLDELERPSPAGQEQPQ